MVTAVSSSKLRSGVFDWLVQRVTAVILLAYFIFMAFVVLRGVSYGEWAALYEQLWMKVFTSLAALSLAAHAWIGMWGVFTDYLTERLLGPRGNTMRSVMQWVTSLSLLVYVLWSVKIIWG